MTQFRIAHHLSLVAAAAALMLGACSRNDDQTVGQKVDEAIATTEQKAAEVKADVKDSMAEAKAASERTADTLGTKIENATDKVGAKVESMTEKVGNAVDDAAVTASINAELAKDPELSALKIDVDTTNGRVLLSGKAPTTDSRERATRLASSVKGVNSVDNRLQVGG
jgi:hyperosmotically inducible periplasmic protein